jgi:SWI/SNF-related matrix-associated actin-dependent regulator 1 of chromatin subfamily A
MAMTPYPHQIKDAVWMASRAAALNAADCRTGKTGTAILAADYVLADKVLVVTTASGRAVWRKGFRDWQAFPREPTIVSWGELTQSRVRAQILNAHFDVLIADESHYGKSLDALRTQALYGANGKPGAISRADRVWCLSATPVPNAPNDLYPMMRALCPERLAASGDRPDVTTYEVFLKRYCVVKPKKIGFYRWVDVVIGGRNLAELKARLDGFVLRRTQADVGIRPPVYETFPLTVTSGLRKQTEAGLDAARVLAAAEAGDTRELEMHLGPLRRLTGEIKAHAVVEAVKEEFECGTDKVVLMAWHKETIRLLAEGLRAFRPIVLDGSTSPKDREAGERLFRTDPGCRVFVGQIQAAGEAIDLSAAALLIFVESSFTPKDMAQAALRITNHSQARQAVVRVATLQGSIDEALQTVLLRKWTAIREVME